MIKSLNEFKYQIIVCFIVYSLKIYVKSFASVKSLFSKNEIRFRGIKYFGLICKSYVLLVSVFLKRNFIILNT